MTAVTAATAAMTARLTAWYDILPYISGSCLKLLISRIEEAALTRPLRITMVYDTGSALAITRITSIATIRPIVTLKIVFCVDLSAMYLLVAPVNTSYARARAYITAHAMLLPGRNTQKSGIIYGISLSFGLFCEIRYERTWEMAITANVTTHQRGFAPK